MAESRPLNCFRSSKNGLIPGQRLPATSADMLLASEHYAGLELADDSVWLSCQRMDGNECALSDCLGAKQVHPVLLSAWRDSRAANWNGLLRLLEVLIVRYQLSVR